MNLRHKNDIFQVNGFRCCCFLLFMHIQQTKDCTRHLCLAYEPHRVESLTSDDGKFILISIILIKMSF